MPVFLHGCKYLFANHHSTMSVIVILFDTSYIIGHKDQEIQILTAKLSINSFHGL